MTTTPTEETSPMTTTPDDQLDRAAQWCRQRGIPTKYAPNVLDQVAEHPDTTGDVMPDDGPEDAA